MTSRVFSRIDWRLLCRSALGHYPYPNSGVYLELVASIGTCVLSVVCKWMHTIRERMWFCAAVSEKPPIPTGKFSPEFESFITAWYDKEK